MLCVRCGIYPRAEERTVCGKCRYQEQKEDHREYNKTHRKRINELMNENRKERVKFVAKIKSKKGCIDCGIKDWRVLDFHHIKGSPGKRNRICYLVATRASFERIDKEIKKCIVLCSNCHRIRHKPSTI